MRMLHCYRYNSVDTHRKNKKETAEYRRSALQVFALVLHKFDIDWFINLLIWHFYHENTDLNIMQTDF